MLETHVVMQRTRSPGFQWWLKNVNEEKISSEKLKIKHPYWFFSGPYQLQTNISSNPRCQASASVFWRTKKVQIWFWECYFSAICLLWDAQIPSSQSVGSEKTGGNKEICLFLLMASKAYQEYLLWKAPRAPLERVDQHRVNTLAAAMLELRGRRPSVAGREHLPCIRSLTLRRSSPPFT